MISLIVPTRNRAHTLRRVGESYYAQDGVDEIIFVSDAGDDESAEVIEAIARSHPAISTQFVRTEARVGAAGARNIGVGRAKNTYILFCDDDEYLLPGYASTCLQKLLSYDAGAVSGRHVYMLQGETPEAAAKRFGAGLRRARPFNYLLMERVNGAIHEGDISVPFTHSIILTRRDDLMEEPFDPYYARGNGYREESDYQIRLFLKGKPIIVTNDAYCVHLPLAEVQSGGQRTSLPARLGWTLFYTRYFYRKHYPAYAARVGLVVPWRAALGAFAVFACYREILRPTLHGWAMRALSRRSPPSPRPPRSSASRPSS